MASIRTGGITRPRKRGRSLLRTAALALLALLAVSASACFYPSGSPIKMHDNYEMRDPSAVPLGGGLAQLYTTNSGFFWVPTYVVDPNAWGAYASPKPHDALPKPPSWVKPNVGDGRKFVWAPTVRKVNGVYLMMFTASRRQGRACIGAAVSNTAAGPFTAIDDDPWCETAGLLDPQLFVNADGRIWVYYSRQIAPTFSEIRAQQITLGGSGLNRTVNRVGSAKRILTMDQARAVCRLRYPVTSCTTNPGPTPANHFVENPAMVRDSYNGYSLMVSLGNWKDNSYTTLEIPCTQPDGGCLNNFGAQIKYSDSQYNQAGGASFLKDNSPAGNRIFFHARPPGSLWAVTYSQALTHLKSG